MNRLITLLLPPAAWCVIWLVSLINQVDVNGEVNADFQSLRIVGRDGIPDWDLLMRTALVNRRRTRLKLGISLSMLIGGILAIAALLADIPILHSILNLLLSACFFVAGFFFLVLSYTDRGVYRISASPRIREVTGNQGVME